MDPPRWGEWTSQISLVRFQFSTWILIFNLKSHRLEIWTLIECYLSVQLKSGFPEIRFYLIRIFKLKILGSEKVGKTGATGETLEEAKKINQSLSSLGNCINALVERKVKSPSTWIQLDRSISTWIQLEIVGSAYSVSRFQVDTHSSRVTRRKLKDDSSHRLFTTRLQSSWNCQVLTFSSWRFKLKTFDWRSHFLSSSCNFQIEFSFKFFFNFQILIFYFYQR